ncbi:MAG: hypothetical protein GY761_13150 [Hyphomicrobiales bacterium]|nr:hypothetical protein [Hyphomicrobiales bacterium]
MTGYTAGFSGLLSTGTGGTQDIATSIPGALHYHHYQWRYILKNIIQLNKAGNLPRPLCLFGHSMGAEAVLEIADELRRINIVVDYAGIIDLTFGPVTKAGNNIKLLQEFHSQFQRVSFDNFQGTHEYYNLDKIMDDNIGHSEAARLDFTQNKIVETITSLTKGKTVLPAELSKMVIEAGEAINPANETSVQTKFNQVFFSAIRPTFGAISPQAVDGTMMIIHAFDTYIAPKGYDDNLLAFVLGNVFNETGKRMVPVRETNAKTHAGAMAALDNWWDSGGAKNAGVKSRYWKDGYYGRGLFQETHLSNYSKGSVLWEKWFVFPLDLVINPDLFLNPIVSALSAFIGSIEGKYTGKKFSDFCTNSERDFVSARSMVNGDINLRLRDVDGDGVVEKMGDEIGQVCEAFFGAISKARGAVYTVPTLTPEPPKPPMIEPISGIEAARDMLDMYVPDLKLQNREMAIAMELMRRYFEPDRPPEIPTIDLQPNPSTEAGFSLPMPKGNNMLAEMFSTTLNLKSKTTLTGIFSALAGLALFVLPEGNMIVDLVRSIYPDVDPGSLLTMGLGLIFGRDAIRKLEK